MTTAAEALAAYYAANGIEADPARAATWICRIGPASIEFPNWKWRRDAVTRHDAEGAERAMEDHLDRMLDAVRRFAAEQRRGRGGKAARDDKATRKR